MGIRDQDHENQVFDSLHFWSTKSLRMLSKSWHGDEGSKPGAKVFTEGEGMTRRSGEQKWGGGSEECAGIGFIKMKSRNFTREQTY